MNELLKVILSLSLGDTLISAIGTGERYQASLASVTLHESGERLKERLEAKLKLPYPDIQTWILRIRLEEL